MKKLELSVEELKVEAFETGPAGAQEGTVHARDASTPFGCATYNQGDPACMPFTNDRWDSRCVDSLYLDHCSAVCETGSEIC